MKATVLYLSLFILLLSGCRNEKGYVKTEGMIWNTLYHVTYKGNEELSDSIVPLLDKIGESLSVFDKSSLVSQLNSSNEIEADEHLITIYETSGKIHRLSNGLFDPTVSPLIDAWGFGLEHSATSDTLAIDSILNFVGYDKTHLEGNKIIKEDIRTRFNFSAIAKGYGADAVGRMLLRNGVKDFMVEIGGEISLKGVGPSGEKWRIGIDSPIDSLVPGNSSAIIIALTDAGMATSGNYRNFRMEGGRKVAHTISPKSGEPFLSEILSATVIASTCMEADGLATACMAGNPDQAISLLKKFKAEGFLILSDSVWMTPGFKSMVISEVSEPVGTFRN